MASRNSRSRTQTRPISSGVWFSLFLVFGIILWFFWRLPLVPFLWLGMLAGGITQQYPVNASGSRKDPPSDKQMMVYHRWKDMLAGLMPNADWLEIRRVSWWMGWMAGMLLGLNGAVWIALVDGLFGFMLAQGWSHYRNRRVDRRHVYKGVSIPAFLTKSPVWARLLSVSMPLLVFAGVLVFVLTGYMSWLSAVTLPGFVFLLLVWLLGRKPQSRYWRELVEGQQLLDGWLAGDDLQKAWSGAYLTQVNKIGSSDNPLIVYRIRLQGSDGNSLERRSFQARRGSVAGAGIGGRIPFRVSTVRQAEEERGGTVRPVQCPSGAWHGRILHPLHRGEKGRRRSCLSRRRHRLCANRFHLA